MDAIRGVLIHHLRTAGYQISETDDAALATQMAIRERSDLIILDIVMPKLDGYTVLKKLKTGERTKEIPVLICSVKGNREDVLRAMQLGAADYLVKPFTKSSLLEKVRHLLELSSSNPPPRTLADVPSDRERHP
jgi:DNA-binding response OmpR family regulator